MHDSAATALAATLAGARRDRRRRLGWILVLCASGAAGAHLWLSTRAHTADEARIEYVGAPVTRGPLVVKVTATGTLEPLTQVDVGSELSGMVEDVMVDFNETVTRGQLLARLDTDRLQATAVQARGSLAAANARLQEAHATVTEMRLKAARCAKLAERQMCATDELDAVRAAQARAEAGVASAAAEVAVARASLQERETELAKAAIHSPIDGIVLKRLIEPGQTVAAIMQTPVLFTLAENLTQMELRVAVDEADVGVVAAEQAALFTVDAYPSRTFPARVTEVRYAPETKDGVVTYTTVLSVDNTDLALRPGMTATAEIVVAEIADALLVPNAALRFAPPAPPTPSAQPGLLSRLMMRFPARQTSAPVETPSGNERTLWVIEDGKLRAVPVTVGATDEQRTEVLTGALRAEQQVAVDYTAID